VTPGLPLALAPGLPLATTLQPLCFGREPKARVATILYSKLGFEVKVSFFHPTISRHMSTLDSSLDFEGLNLAQVRR
jgi:hypothetical protein